MSTVANNGSAWGKRTSLGLTGDFTVCGWAKLTSGSFNSKSIFALYPTTAGAGESIRVDANNSGDVYLAYATSYDWKGPSTDHNNIWRHYVVSRTGSTIIIYQRAETDVVYTSWASFTYTDSFAQLNLFASQYEEQIAACSIRSWRIHNDNLANEAAWMAESLSATPVVTSSLVGAYADGTNPGAAPTSWYIDTSTAAVNLTATGTAVQDATDPITPPSGTTVNPSGQSAGIATSIGTFGLGLGLLGRSAGIAAQAGILGNLWALPGRSLGIAATVGALVPAPAQAVTGRSAGIGANAGSLAPQGAYALGGRSAGIATTVGTLGNSNALVGQTSGIATTAGALGVSDGQTLTGQPAGISAQAGILGNLVALLGRTLGVAVNAGALGVSDAASLGGQTLGITAVVGTIASSDVMLGRSLGIAANAGALGPSTALGITGQVLGLAVGNGSLGVTDAHTLTGYVANISAQAGSVGASQSGDTTPSGQTLGIGAQAGSLGVSDAAAVLGYSLGIAAQAGTLGGAQGLTGLTLGISAVGGTLGPTVPVSLLGRFIGIATQAGNIDQPGESITRSLTGFALGIGAYANALTWIDYGPPVDFAYVQQKIDYNDAVQQYAISDVWRSKATTDGGLPETFPYRSRLNAVGYLSVRQTKAAAVLDLVFAGFTMRQAERIVTEAAKL